ncbi:hypothetical protein BDA96_10G183500, partial [Sorghum bicolor]
HSSSHFLTNKTSSPHLLSSLNSILSLTHFNSHQRGSTLISSPPSIRWAPSCSPFPMAAVPTPSPSPPSKPKDKLVCSSVLPLHISFRCRIPGMNSSHLVAKHMFIMSPLYCDVLRKIMVM